MRGASLLAKHRAVENAQTPGRAVMDKSADRIARKRDAGKQALEAVAGNGLIDRRALLGRGVVFAGAMGAGIGPSAAGAEPLADDPWSLEIGEATPPYQMRSKFEA